MYTFSSKLKTTALVLMILGLVGIVYGFLSAPKTIEEARKNSCRKSSLKLHNAEANMNHDATHTMYLEAKLRCRRLKINTSQVTAMNFKNLVSFK
jgi:hypothetical protein